MPSVSAHRGIITFAAAGGALHAAHRFYDSPTSPASLAHWLADTLPLVLCAALFLLTLPAVGARRGRSVRQGGPPVARTARMMRSADLDAGTR